MARPRKICSKWIRKRSGIEANYDLYLSHTRDAHVECYYEDPADEGEEPEVHGWAYTVTDGDIEFDSGREYETPEEAMLEAEKALVKILDDTIVWASREKSKLFGKFSKRKVARGFVK